MSGGGGSPSSTTTVNQLFSPEEAARRAQVMSEAERLYGQFGQQFATAPYPGAKPVGPSAATTSAQESLLGYAGGAGKDYASQVQQAGQFGLSDVLFPETNPALRATQAAAIRPVTEAYTDPGGVFSNIRTEAIQAGGFGGSRQGVAEGIAGGRYLSTIGDISSKIASEGYAQGLNTFEKSLALGPQTFALGTQPGAITSAVGTQQEAFGQAGEDYAGAARAWELNAPWMGLQNYANIVFGGAAPGTQTTATGPGPKSNTALTSLGGAAMGAYLGPLLGLTGPIGAGIGLVAGLLSS